MPLRRRPHDFELGGKGFMLARPQQRGGRSWQRSGAPDTPERRSPSDPKYGELPGEIEFVEVWEDWSGGIGKPYRDPTTPNMFRWAENMETRFPNQAIHAQRLQAPPGVDARRVNSFIEVPPPGGGAARHNSILTLGQERIVRYDVVDSASMNVTMEISLNTANFGEPGPPALFGSYSWLPQLTLGAGAPRQRGHDATYSTITNLPATRGFHVAGGRMFRSFDDYRLQSVAIGADPAATADWGATFNIGNGNAPINDMVSYNEQLFLGLPIGMFAGDLSATFLNVLGDIAGVGPDNCRDLEVHAGGVVAPVGGQLFHFIPSNDTAIVREIGPPLGNRSPIRGTFRAVKSFGRWLFAAVNNVGQDEDFLLAGHDASFPLPYVWHAAQRFAAPIKRLYIDGVLENSAGAPIHNRMWIATDYSLNSDAPLSFFPIPRGHANPLDDPSFTPNYAASARINLGRTDKGAPGTPKIYKSVEVRTDGSTLTGTANGQWAEIWYRVDGKGETFNYLDTVATSPLSVLFFPHGEGSWVIGHDIELSYRSFTTSGNICPVLRSIALRGALIARSVDHVAAQVRITDDLRNREGAPMRDAMTMLNELRAMHDKPRVLIDPTGAQHFVNVSPVVEEQELWDDSGNFELIATAHMAVLEYTDSHPVQAN